MELRKPFAGSGRRSGQVYSLIAILLSIPVMLFIAFYVTETQDMRYGALERVVSDQLHEVEKGLENDFEQAMTISGKRAFLAATDYVIREGEPLDDSELRLQELLTQGTIYGEFVFVMNNNTIQDWVDKISSLEFGFDVDIDYTTPLVTDLDGMNAKLTTTLEINVSDHSNIAKISKYVIKEVVIPLEGVEDPIFPLNTLGFVPRAIRDYPYPYHAIRMTSGTSGLGSCSGEVTFDSGDPDPSEKILVISNASGISGFAGVVGELPDSPSSVPCYISGATGAVADIANTTSWSGYDEIYIDGSTREAWSLPINHAIENGYYSQFAAGGPGIMERLEGDLTGKTDGIETFVDLPFLQSKSLPIKPEQVSIAYLYFSNQTINGQSVRGLPSWFRTDAANAARYNLTGLM